jgi:predicted PurR-regulated permease PerM
MVIAPGWSGGWCAGVGRAASASGYSPHQQIENYWLSPKLSAQSMEINGGVAFGSALAGGAIAGPMGAVMAMPIAALITSFVKHYVPCYELAYH